VGDIISDFGADGKSGAFAGASYTSLGYGFRVLEIFTLKKIGG
jgi:hypothetical protein